VPLGTGLDAIQLVRMAPLQRLDLLLQCLGGHGFFPGAPISDPG
jgi:hypothetical protein